jgi:YegS/Rv2252/BmrU family lipid kinase
MKKIKFIYNPNAGKGLVLKSLDDIVKVYQNHGYEISFFRIDENKKEEKIFENFSDDYSHILIAGGDGTINLIINQMMKNKINVPIGILPTGTVNDFSSYIGMSKNIVQSCEQVLENKPIKMDLGKVNDKYFINVASSGFLTNVSQEANDNLKNSVGKIAYYLKGIEQLPKLKKIPVRIKSNEVDYQGDIYTIFVFNVRTAGNFKLAYNAEGNDGKFDVIILKSDLGIDSAALLIKFIKGEHLEEPVGILHFQTKELYVESPLSDLLTDIDGEKGSDFPLKITCLHEKVTILGVKNT